MRTEANRLMVLSISVLAAEKALREYSEPRDVFASGRPAESTRRNALDSLAVIATELETAARELERAPEGNGEGKADPSDGWAALDWYVTNVINSDERGGKVWLEWFVRGDDGENTHTTTGDSWREAITKAMGYAKAMGDPIDATRGEKAEQSTEAPT